jgi:hypothetical protein
VSGCLYRTSCAYLRRIPRTHCTLGRPPCGKHPGDDFAIDASLVNRHEARTVPRPVPQEVRPKPHPKGSYSETITTSSPSISSAGTAP